MIGWLCAGVACVVIAVAAASGTLDAVDSLRGSPMRPRR